MVLAVPYYRTQDSVNLHLKATEVMNRRRTSLRIRSFDSFVPLSNTVLTGWFGQGKRYDYVSVRQGDLTAVNKGDMLNPALNQI